MSFPENPQVLIVGGGPCGLMLANDPIVAWRGHTASAALEALDRLRG